VDQRTAYSECNGGGDHKKQNQRFPLSFYGSLQVLRAPRRGDSGGTPGSGVRRHHNGPARLHDVRGYPRRFYARRVSTESARVRVAYPPSTCAAWPYPYPASQAIPSPSPSRP
jgi:hypothetical protein